MSAAPDVLIRRWFEELWNQGREDTIDHLLASHCVLHGLPTPGNQAIGREGFRQLYLQFREAFPDMRVTVVRTIREGDVVAAHCEVSGTHLGDSLGAKATGRVVEFSGCVIARESGAQFIEGWNFFDFLSLYQQIGLVELPS